MFNPDFWEVTLASQGWERFSNQDALWHETSEDAEAKSARSRSAARLWPEVRALVREILTDRQREVVELTFFEGLNQRQIAERLAITQQAVSEHLYGKARDGRNVGGAIRKLRKACAKRGIRWECGA
jgi:DNA-directed RNA polymerase specialized sigma subunit